MFQKSIDKERALHELTIYDALPRDKWSKKGRLA